MQIFTTTMTTGTMVINREDGAMFISIQPAENASCTVLGGISFNGVESTPLTLNSLQIASYAASSAASPLDGITITHISGDIDILVGF